MVTVERLQIDIDINVGDLVELDRLASNLRELATTQATVDERQDINVDADGHGSIAALTANIQALNATMMEAKALSVGGIADGGVADGGRSGLPMGAGSRHSGILGLLDKFSLRMSSLHNLLANLIPLLANFILAIPAAITGLIAVGTAALGAAAALAAIGGFAAMGFAMQGGEFQLDRLTDALEGIRDDFIDTFGPLANRLEPLFRRGLDGLSMFFEAMADRGGILLALRDEAEAFGQFILDFVPDAVASIGRFTDAMAPALAAVGAFINDTEFMQSMAQMMNEILPLFEELGPAIATLLPGLVRLSIGFLAVSTMILMVIEEFTQLINVIPGGAMIFGVLAGTALTLISVLGTLAFAATVVSKSMAILGITSLSSVVPALEAYTIATLEAAIGTYGLASAIGALLAITGIGLLAVGIGIAAKEMWTLGSNIERATKSLKRFDSVNSNLGDTSLGMGSSASTSGGNVYVNDNSQTTIATNNVADGKRLMNKKEYQDSAIVTDDYR